MYTSPKNQALKAYHAPVCNVFHKLVCLSNVSTPLVLVRSPICIFAMRTMNIARHGMKRSSARRPAGPTGNHDQMYEPELERMKESTRQNASVTAAAEQNLRCSCGVRKSLYSLMRSTGMGRVGSASLELVAIVCFVS